MNEILANITKKGSFEYSLVNEFLQDMKKVLTGKDMQKFKPLSQYYNDFLKQVNEHYNAAFEDLYFEEFDNVATPLLMPVLKELTFEFQKFLDPQQTYSNQQFVAACKKYQNLTQEELNVKEEFTLKCSNPFDKAIKDIKQISSVSTFKEISDLILTAFQSIYTDVAKVSTKLLTGDDLTDIVVYVVLKSCGANLVQTMYCFINSLPQQMLQGEIGYNSMAITIAISMICTMTADYIRKTNIQLKDTDLLNKRYLLPFPHLYSEIIAETNDTQKPLQFIKNIEIQGYQTFYCLEYFLKLQFIKTVTIKCNCQDTQICQHKTSCAQVQLSPNLTVFQAQDYNSWLKAQKQQACYCQDLEDGSLVVLKSLDASNLQMQSLTLLQGNKLYVQQELIQILLLHRFGCINTNVDVQDEIDQLYQKRDQQEQENLVNDEQKKRSQQTLALKSPEIEFSKQQFEEAYNSPFLVDETIPQSISLNMLGLFQLICSYLHLSQEQIPSNVEIERILDHFQTVDYNFLQNLYNLKNLRNHFIKLPCLDIQKYLCEKIQPRQLTMQNTDIGILLTKISSFSYGCLPFEEDCDQINFDIYTPLILQLILQLLQYYIMLLELKTGPINDLDILTTDGYFKLVKQLFQLQQENGLQMSGVFDSLTIELLLDNLECMFLKDSLGILSKCKIIQDIYGYE